MGIIRPISLKWRCTVFTSYIVNRRGDQKEGE